VLDPDGDLVDYLRAQGRAKPDASWACYHTVLDTVDLHGSIVGIVGRAVGAPFAVLVADLVGIGWAIGVVGGLPAAGGATGGCFSAAFGCAGQSAAQR
jgi:hypothetical protein